MSSSEKVVRRCEVCGNLHRARVWADPSKEIFPKTSRCPACKLVTSIARHATMIANLEERLRHTRGSAKRTSLRLRLKIGPESAKLIDGHVPYLEEPRS